MFYSKTASPAIHHRNSILNTLHTQWQPVFILNTRNEHNQDDGGASYSIFQFRHNIFQYGHKRENTTTPRL